MKEKQLTKPTFVTCKGGYLGNGEAKKEPLKKPDFNVIENLIREIITAQTTLKYSYQPLEITKDGKVLYSRCLNNGEEITFQTTWEYTEYGVTVDFIHAAPIVKTNKNNDMKTKKINEEEEPMVNEAIAFQEPDDTEDYPINDNADEPEEETTTEEPLPPNASIDFDRTDDGKPLGFTRKYADNLSLSDEEPMSPFGDLK